MNKPIRSVSHQRFQLSNQMCEIAGEQIIELNQGFEWISTPANAFQSPQALHQAKNKQLLHFSPAIVPGTVAMLIDQTQEKNAHLLASLHDMDHWYCMSFDATSQTAGHTFLQFDGLLTLADVYLNNVLILQSHNAFHAHSIDVSDKIKEKNELYICFKALTPLLNAKHARAKFSTRLINARNLRFIRTPILGYTPGFSASTKAVGPYRAIRLINQRKIQIESNLISTQLVGDSTGKIIINVALRLTALTWRASDINAHAIVFDEDSGELVKRIPIETMQDASGLLHLNAQFEVPNIGAYWPHTHGQPKRYLVSIELAIANELTHIKLGQFGFKRIARINPDNFSLSINGVAVFLRGACWTPINPTSLLVGEEILRERLILLRDAGLNMLRVPGNMLYESDDFYAICDELGILIFQDFAFANFDYPESDEAFVTTIQQEATTFLTKHGARPCLTVLAGNSEVAQQACMMGLALNEINNAIFDHDLADIAAKFCPHIPYVHSSPSNNGIPFHSGNGPSHYYGVGGYRRGFDDARLFKGTFASECLAFSHVPEDQSLRTFYKGEVIPPHHPLWKEGIARDVGSGWDFSDITDFYVEQLFDINVAQLRTTDQQRYLNYCRAATAETVERTLSIFRANSTHGRAALVWNLHDFKPGAGWGYIDTLGQPKSAFYALARTARPTTLLFVDEGLEGLAVYTAHDGATLLNATLSMSLVTAEGQLFEHKSQTISLSPQSVTRFSVDFFLNRFVDSSYAYRFGPRAFTSCVAKLVAENGEVLAQKIYADTSVTHTMMHDIGLKAIATTVGAGQYHLTVTAQQPAFYVVIDVPEFKLSNNYFHVLPGFDKTIVITTKDIKINPHGRVRALNTKTSTPIQRADD